MVDHYKLCPLCGHFVHIHFPDKYCIACGTKLIDSCTSCNAPIESPVARFCPQCGGGLTVIKTRQKSRGRATRTCPS
ncbi:zinc ribbon domain-containing protein [bacterium]|nr:zinc ribbon domain-containing protein [bacterium]